MADYRRQVVWQIAWLGGVENAWKVRHQVNRTLTAVESELGRTQHGHKACLVVHGNCDVQWLQHYPCGDIYQLLVCKHHDSLHYCSRSIYGLVTSHLRQCQQQHSQRLYWHEYFE